MRKLLLCVLLVLLGLLGPLALAVTCPPEMGAWQYTSDYQSNGDWDAAPVITSELGCWAVASIPPNSETTVACPAGYGLVGTFKSAWPNNKPRTIEDEMPEVVERVYPKIYVPAGPGVPGVLGQQGVLTRAAMVPGQRSQAGGGLRWAIRRAWDYRSVIWKDGAESSTSCIGTSSGYEPTPTPDAVTCPPSMGAWQYTSDYACDFGPRELLSVDSGPGCWIPGAPLPVVETTVLCPAGYALYETFPPVLLGGRMLSIDDDMPEAIDRTYRRPYVQAGPGQVGLSGVQVTTYRTGTCPGKRSQPNGTLRWAIRQITDYESGLWHNGSPSQEYCVGALTQ